MKLHNSPNHPWSDTEDVFLAYTYTQSTRQQSSRKPRGDPAEYPAEHPGGTCRPSGPQGLDVRHRALHSQPCTASHIS
jgi:hypothetical protein